MPVLFCKYLCKESSDLYEIYAHKVVIDHQKNVMQIRPQMRAHSHASHPNNHTKPSQSLFLLPSAQPDEKKCPIA